MKDMSKIIVWASLIASHIVMTIVFLLIAVTGRGVILYENIKPILYLVLGTILISWSFIIRYVNDQIKQFK